MLSKQIIAAFNLRERRFFKDNKLAFKQSRHFAFWSWRSVFNASLVAVAITYLLDERRGCSALTVNPSLAEYLHGLSFLCDNYTKEEEALKTKFSKSVV